MSTLNEQVSNARILIVDDTKIMRTLMQRLLHQLGYENVTEVENGQSALEYVSGNQVDLMILDIMMPEMDGFQMLEQLKSQEKLSDMAVIMVTAVEEIESVARCIELGAKDYMHKLFNPILFNLRIQANLQLLFLQQKLQTNETD